MESKSKINLSFEDAIAKLEKLTEQLESGKLSLEDSIAAYTEGVQLRKFCEEKLQDAEGKIVILDKGPGGVAARPVELDGDDSLPPNSTRASLT